jgi:DNA-binding transcriptional regulator GbsR (MarR family)
VKQYGMPQEVRFNKIMEVVKNSNQYLTSSEICGRYLGQYSSSDVNSTGQILNVLSYIGIVKRIYKPRSQRSFYVAYKMEQNGKA